MAASQYVAVNQTGAIENDYEVEQFDWSAKLTQGPFPSQTHIHNYLIEDHYFRHIHAIDYDHFVLHRPAISVHSGRCVSAHSVSTSLLVSYRGGYCFVIIPQPVLAAVHTIQALVRQQLMWIGWRRAA